MGASTFDAAQMDAIGAVSLDTFAECLLSSLGAGRAVAEGTQAPLMQALIDGMAHMPLLGEVAKRAKAVVARAELVQSPFAGEIGALRPSEQRARTESAVLEVVRELTGADGASVGAETPLMEAGVDSLAATELSSRLRSMSGVSLSPTIVFDSRRRARSQLTCSSSLWVWRLRL